MSTAAATSSLVYEWKDVPWKAVERAVFKLQKRIYRASQAGSKAQVRRLQKLLIGSRYARLLAVRKVTQDNTGKRTAGVDGKLALSQRSRIRLAQNLKLEPKATPVRRVWIPKRGTDEKRPLGIPTIESRAQQALAKLALEPEWEARFEPNSFGFRPGRSAHDAMEAIQSSIRYTPKYVLDADIAKCFDRINHKALLDKLSTFAGMRRAVKTWLKAKIMDGDELFPSEAGTPQGGVISPLLANIALHGLETAVSTAFPKHPYINGKQRGRYQPRVIRYADDFVVLHEDVKVIEKAKEVAQEWLKGLGLELKPSKTRITHTLDEYDGGVGFDFLGFHVRQYRVGKPNYMWQSQLKILRKFKPIIKPSRDAVLRHYRHVADTIERMKASKQEDVICKLNPIIRGWSNYYSTVVSKVIFSKLDHLVTKKLLRWAYQRHNHQARRETAAKYWTLPKRGERGWTFQASEQDKLLWYADTPIRRHNQVAGEQSPYNGNWTYWGKRLRTYPVLTSRQRTLLVKQKGRCRSCGLYFKMRDLIEVDHILARRFGGKDEYANLQLLHLHCHDVKTAHENVVASEGINDNDHVTEEPCEDERLMHGSEDKTLG